MQKGDTSTNNTIHHTPLWLRIIQLRSFLTPWELTGHSGQGRRKANCRSLPPFLLLQIQAPVLFTALQQNTSCRRCPTIAPLPISSWLDLLLVIWFSPLFALSKTKPSPSGDLQATLIRETDGLTSDLLLSLSSSKCNPSISCLDLYQITDRDLSFSSSPSPANYTDLPLVAFLPGPLVLCLPPSTTPAGTPANIQATPGSKYADCRSIPVLLFLQSQYPGFIPSSAKEHLL